MGGHRCEWQFASLTDRPDHCTCVFPVAAPAKHHRSSLSVPLPPLPLCPTQVRPHRQVFARSAYFKKAKVVATLDLTEKRKTPTTTSATDFATGKKRCFQMGLQMRAATRKAKKAKKGKKGKKAKTSDAQGSE